MILGNFDAKSKLWFDQDNAANEGSILNDLITQYCPAQIIHKPTHILESSFPCIDLFFISQENLEPSSGVYSS